MLARITLTCLLLAALGPIDDPEPSVQEREALDALAKLGVHNFADPRSGFPPGTVLVYRPDPKAERPAKLSAKELAPLARLQRTRAVQLNDAPVGDDVIALLLNMPELRRLWLSNTRISDDGLKKLARIKSLEILAVGGNAVTDAGIAHLRAIPYLEVLDLRFTKATDGCCKALASFPTLAELSLRGCRGLKGSGIAALQNSKTLTQLDLGQTELNDTVIPSIRKLSTLVRLFLDHTKVTGGGFVVLVQPDCLPKLWSIDVAGTSVNDRAIEALYNPKALPELHRLNLLKTPVTDEGLAALKKARPVIVPR